jgi:hypothetical protein
MQRTWIRCCFQSLLPQCDTVEESRSKSTKIFARFSRPQAMTTAANFPLMDRAGARREKAAARVISSPAEPRARQIPVPAPLRGWVAGLRSPTPRIGLARRSVARDSRPADNLALLLSKVSGRSPQAKPRSFHLFQTHASQRRMIA